MIRKKVSLIKYIFTVGLACLALVACSMAGPKKVGQGVNESSPTSQQNEPVEPPVANLPDDIRLVIERLQLCNHFAGEINGDRSERDKEVFATMSELKCDTIESDAASLRKKYAEDPVILDELDHALDF